MFDYVTEEVILAYGLLFVAVGIPAIIIILWRMG